MSSRHIDKRIAARKALELRKRLGISLASPVCVFDAADRLGVDVRFCDVKSLGGMYVRENGCILLPSDRPHGRLAFTCAHELGHWVFSHGTRVDLLVESDNHSCWSPEETIANTFAAFFLMPPRAVTRAFQRRGLSPSVRVPLSIYTVACQLGVGYGTLITQLHTGLGLIDKIDHQELSRTSPKEIRERVLGVSTPGSLVIVDRCWEEIAVDLEVGDHVVLPKNAHIDGDAAVTRKVRAESVIAEAVRPGVARAFVSDAEWTANIRVRRKRYVGLNAYRHFEDVDNDPDS